MSICQYVNILYRNIQSFFVSVCLCDMFVCVCAYNMKEHGNLEGSGGFSIWIIWPTPQHLFLFFFACSLCSQVSHTREKKDQVHQHNPMRRCKNAPQRMDLSVRFRLSCFQCDLHGDKAGSLGYV